MRLSAPISTLAMLAASACMSCTDKAAPDTELQDSDPPEEGEIRDLEPTCTLSTAITTVCTAEWTTPTAGTSYVEWGTGHNYGHRTVENANTRTDHRVVVAGFPTNTEIFWRAVSVIDGETHTSGEQSITSGVRPQGIIRFDVEAIDGDYTPGFRLLPALAEPAYVVIVDDVGEVVWWYPVPDGMNATDTKISNDQTHVLFLATDASRTQDIGGVYSVSLDGMEETFTAMHNAHHTFVELPEGDYAYMGFEARDVRGLDLPVVGDVLVRIDRDGENSTELYNIWDHYTPDATAIANNDTVFYPDMYDWSHGNSINLDPADNTLAASFHNLDAFSKITLDGTLMWTMGGEASDFELVGPGTTLFSHQHNPHTIGDGRVLMFDNGPYDNPDVDYSEAAEYQFDTTAMTFERVWNFDWNKGQVVYLMGDVVRQPNGNTFTTWGSVGDLIEVSESGEIVWHASPSVGGVIAFSDFKSEIGGVLE